MNRYPGIVANSGGILSARGNGFLRRKAFTIPGSYTFSLPNNLPLNEDGLIRVMGFAIGGGGGGDDSNSGGANGGGAGGGFSQKELYVQPDASFSVVVGIAGPSRNSSPSNIVGGTTSITIDGQSWQATGGQTSVGGIGTGGDINTQGGASVTSPNNADKISGSSAGSPWGNGRVGAWNTEGGKWLIPNFWDLSDILSESFVAYEGIGMGADASASNPKAATAGGGGRGGFNASQPGAPGLAVIYW